MKSYPKTNRWASGLVGFTVGLYLAVVWTKFAIYGATLNKAGEYVFLGRGVVDVCRFGLLTPLACAMIGFLFHKSIPLAVYRQVRFQICWGIIAVICLYLLLLQKFYSAPGFYSPV